MEFDYRNGVVVHEGREILLTPQETEVFNMLWDSLGNWVSTKDIERVLFYKHSGVANTKVFIMRLRRKGVPIENRPFWGYRVN